MCENLSRETERKLKTWMQLLKEFCNVNFVVGCNGQLLECAKQPLEQNNYETNMFTEDVRLSSSNGVGEI